MGKKLFNMAHSEHLSVNQQNNNSQKNATNGGNERVKLEIERERENLNIGQIRPEATEKKIPEEISQSIPLEQNIN